MNLDLAPDPLLVVPGPSQIPPRVMKALMRVVDHRSPHFHRLYRDVVEGLKYVFRTNGDVYPITASGTGAVETMVLNFVKPKDTVVVPIFGSFSRRLVNHLRRVGAEVIEVNYGWTEAPTYDDLRAKVESMGIKHIDVFATVYNDTSPGLVFRDLPKVAKWIRSYGALVLVDNVSALGGDYFEVDSWGVDVAVSSSQKCLAAPPVMSFIAVASGEAYRKADSVNHPSIYFDIKLMKKFGEKMETPFTPAVNYLFAIREALSMVREVSIENWIKWHVERGRAIVNALGKMGLEPFIKNDYHRSTTVLSFKYPQGISPDEFRKMIYKLGVSLSDAMDDVKGKAFRIGNMGYLTRRDVLTLISSIMATLTVVNGTSGINSVDVFKEVLNYWEPQQFSMDEG
ncbi:pyridoxal-phosphate-dependent aminotransferase family protein [Vulcanisaeta souniana]|uniref:Aminotransferase n=1 Tax=Vulcanisaeta souniana JCM 11219 TaxID=1293586 RepID=A0A830ELG5_9CREN|nr:alanine--glyoxylate aminotransferase family protein [Vulcanisaeta souniana]BDR92545.1 aminotransferase [Vulcanisaeta souniana JCM 11219]GGI83020.1 aminotransferase [Vulcanisaeta souniana JCM 11219]